MAPTKKKQKTKQVSLQQSMLKTSDHTDSRASLNKLYKNKRILLKAKELYRGGKIPVGEEKHLFQYHVHEVNEDCKSFTLKFDRVYIIEDTNKFKSYPVTSPGEDLLDEYRMCLFEEDHELYNVYLGRKKKEENDRKDEEMRRRTEAAAADGSFKNLSDIEQLLLSDNVEMYDVLTGEFEAIGEKEEHVSQGAKNKGEVTYKQQWSEFFITCLHILFLYLYIYHSI